MRLSILKVVSTDVCAFFQQLMLVLGSSARMTAFVLMKTARMSANALLALKALLVIQVSIISPKSHPTTFTFPGKRYIVCMSRSQFKESLQSQ